MSNDYHDNFPAFQIIGMVAILLGSFALGDSLAELTVGPHPSRWASAVGTSAVCFVLTMSWMVLMRLWEGVPLVIRGGVMFALMVVFAANYDRIMLVVERAVWSTLNDWDIGAWLRHAILWLRHVTLGHI